MFTSTNAKKDFGKKQKLPALLEKNNEKLHFSVQRYPVLRYMPYDDVQ